MPLLLNRLHVTWRVEYIFGSKTSTVLLNSYCYHRKMSATPSQHSTVKRINRAYVQVPPSPFTISGRRTFQNSPHVASSCNELKENTPLKSLQTPMSYIGSSSTSLKRKLSDREHYFDDVVIPPKQSKLTSASNDTSSKPKQSKISEPANNTLVNFSDGLVYCHQCNKKRDPGGE